MKWIQLKSSKHPSHFEWTNIEQNIHCISYKYITHRYIHPVNMRTIRYWRCHNGKSSSILEHDQAYRSMIEYTLVCFFMLIDRNVVAEHYYRLRRRMHSCFKCTLIVVRSFLPNWNQIQKCNSIMLRQYNNAFQTWLLDKEELFIGLRAFFHCLPLALSFIFSAKRRWILKGCHIRPALCIGIRWDLKR